MRTINYLFIFTLIILFMACSNTPSKKVENWSEKEVNEWFENGKWLEGWDVQPDETINRRELAIQYHKNPERWEKAFEFLATENLATIEKGKYKLEGDNLVANIDEYTTKNEEDARFEAHKIFADIQYVISGEEKIGVVPFSTTTVTDKYVESKDIAFLTAPQNNYRQADSKTFFVFFPGDAHRPCVKTNTNSRVRKVVMKIRIN